MFLGTATRDDLGQSFWTEELTRLVHKGLEQSEFKMRVIDE
jgi:hypothetical protein